MKHTFLLLLALCISAFFAHQVRGQQAADSKIIQVTGVLMSPDSMKVIPNAIVSVVGRESGVVTNEKGVFSMVVNKGDQLRFDLTGYKPVTYQVPANYKGIYISIVQLMTQDTFYLPETIITSELTPEQFDFAFKYKYVPRDEIAYMRRNNNPFTRSMLMNSLPRAGVENASISQLKIFSDYGTNYGQIQMNSLNLTNLPLSAKSWNELLDAWRRSDYRRK